MSSSREGDSPERNTPRERGPQDREAPTGERVPRERDFQVRETPRNASMVLKQLAQLHWTHDQAVLRPCGDHLGKKCHSVGSLPPTLWTTTLSSKINFPHAINKATCGANLVTYHLRIEGNETALSTVWLIDPMSNRAALQDSFFRSNVKSAWSDQAACSRQLSNMASHIFRGWQLQCNCNEIRHNQLVVSANHSRVV